jgi:hypothetical protein
MKLKDLEIFTVAPPSPGWGGRYWTFTKLTTDDGIVGYGECYASSVGPKAMQAVIEDVFTRHMAGENPENIELMFRRAYSSGFTQRPDLTVMGAFSGLEIACWDIIGKARGRPVHAMLGGKINERLRSYTYLYPEPGKESGEFWVSPSAAAEAALRFVDMGFTAVKFDPAGPYTIRGGHDPSGSDITRSVAFCKAIREAVGDRARRWNPMARFGTKSLFRLTIFWISPRCKRQFAFHWPRVRGSPPSPNSPRSCAPAAHVFFNRHWEGLAVSGNARRSRRLPRYSPRRWPRIFMQAHWNGPPIFTWAPRSPIF